MLFRQLFDSTSSTYTYVLGDPATREAIVIDPVFEQHERDAALIHELGLDLKLTLETHVHADHVTGAWLMKERFGSRIALSAHSGAEGADVRLSDGDLIEVAGIRLEARATPGHTAGCLTFVDQEHGMAFTGDALLIRGAGRTDFQHGDAHTLFRSVKERVLSLPDDTLLYPAHDYLGRTCTTVGEERAHNPRLGGEASEEDFVGYMMNLGLPHPKKMDEAVPANLRLGRPQSEEQGARRPTWGPVVQTYAGVPEIDPQWVADHLSQVHVLDVREPAELEGELGHVERAQLIPLGQLRDRLDDVPRDKPVVALCRSGKRSAQATLILQKAGLPEVANVSGGMIRWRSLELPIA